MRKRVILGMSGGVDSSVSAILLKQAGFEVVGVTIQMFETSNTKINEIISLLKIEHHFIDKAKAFREAIIDNFKLEYMNGRTPNPCVRCNRFIKFSTLEEAMNDFDAEFISTGHYARVIDNRLLKGKDALKDQSYFLYKINRDLLSRLTLPLGEITKAQVKEIASQYQLGFDYVKESTDICFLSGHSSYRTLLTTGVPGPILDINGKVIGTHKGLQNYTIGQRKGLGVSSATPLYVKNLDVQNNSLTLAEYKDLFVNIIYIADVNLLTDVPYELLNVMVKVRYAASATPADINFSSDFSSAVIKLISGSYAVAKGQSCVIYKENEVIGGGIIENYE